MKNSSIIALLFIFGIMAVANADADDLTQVGGGFSCAKWFISITNKQLGSYWIEGFWSGRNVEALQRHGPGDIGRNTDTEGIVGEVQKLCRQEPSMTVGSAVTRVYEQFKEQTR